MCTASAHFEPLSTLSLEGADHPKNKNKKKHVRRRALLANVLRCKKTFQRIVRTTNKLTQVPGTKYQGKVGFLFSCEKAGIFYKYTINQHTGKKNLKSMGVLLTVIADPHHDAGPDQTINFDFNGSGFGFSL
jgi:hypothetical protein